MYSPQDTIRIQQLRAKALAGTIELAELKEGIELIRQGRVMAAATSEKSRAKKAASPVDSDKLLGELDGL